jgi:tetratricopeptide (TPR) repeat protein
MKQIPLLLLSLFAVGVSEVAFAQTPAQPAPQSAPVPQVEPPLAIEKQPANAAGRPSPMRRAQGAEGRASGEYLFQYLMSEIAGQRGNSAIAFSGLFDLAKRTRDPRVARRAVELAFQSRQFDQALDSATLWAELDPDSPLARQALSVIAANQGNLETATKTMTRMLAEPGKAPTLFLQLPAILSRASSSGLAGVGAAPGPAAGTSATKGAPAGGASAPDRAKIATIVRDLAKPYPNVPESHFAIAQSTFVAGDTKAALVAINEAERLKSGWAEAAVLKAQILRETSPESAISYMQEFLKANPSATEARLTYARLLVAQKSYLQAREEFRLADVGNTTDPEIPYSIALISQQIEDFPEAEKQFQRTLAMKPRDPNPVLFNLGLVAEARKDINGAIAYFGQVVDSDYFVSAKLKIAGLLAKREGIDSGRKFLQEARDAQGADEDATGTRIQLIQAEAQLLREAKAFKEAFNLLSGAIEKNPDSADILYDRAMIAEKLDKYDVLEADLRRVIVLKPDYAHAYNALGYTLADRNIKLPEAYELIQKALKLSPDDAFIQDSLGWVQFRMGKNAEALATLKKAYKTRRDPEIAAHLGQVLWASGARDEAQELWRTALTESPENESLIAVVQKYKK